MGSYKQKISYEEDLSTEECVMYLRSIMAGLESHMIKLSRAGQCIEMSPADIIHTEIRARKKKSQGSISVEFSWSSVEEEDVELLGSFFPPAPTSIADAVERIETRDVPCIPVEPASFEAHGEVPKMMVAEYLDTLSRDALYEKAQAADIEGRSLMGKDELVIALSADVDVDGLFTHQELYDAARWASISGRSTMDKVELLKALHRELVVMAPPVAAQ